MSLANALVWHQHNVRSVLEIMEHDIGSRPQGVLDVVDLVFAQLALEERLVDAALIVDPDPRRAVYRRARLALFRLATSDVAGAEFEMVCVELKAILELRAQHLNAGWVYPARRPAPRSPDAAASPTTTCGSSSVPWTATLSAPSG